MKSLHERCVENLGGTTIIDLSNRPMSNRAIIWTHRTIF